MTSYINVRLTIIEPSKFVWDNSEGDLKLASRLPSFFYLIALVKQINVTFISQNQTFTCYILRVEGKIAPDLYHSQQSEHNTMPESYYKCICLFTNNNLGKPIQTNICSWELTELFAFCQGPNAHSVSNNKY